MTLPAPPARKARRALDQGVGERLSLGERRPGAPAAAFVRRGLGRRLVPASFQARGFRVPGARVPRRSRFAATVPAPRAAAPRAARRPGSRAPWLVRALRRRRPPEKGRRPLATP